MASLFRQQIVRYVDADGKRIKKSDSGAIRRAESSKKWYGEFKNEHGILERVALATDKASARAMLNKIVIDVERRISGLVSELETHAATQLSEHLEEYGSFLEGKGDSEHHVRLTKTRITKTLEGCGFRRIADLDGVRLSAWLKELRTVDDLSSQTSNYYLGAIKGFCNWLVEHERLERNPFLSNKPLNTKLDRRHDRRAISGEEFQRLVSAANNGKIVESVSGPDRAILYIVAAWTGFRRKELASLRRLAFHLDRDPPHIQLEANASKRKTKDRIPLHPMVVERIRDWLPKSANQFVFPLQTASGKLRKTSKMMKRDLELARLTWLAESTTDEERSERESSDFLSYQDEEGLYADFHANRHTFISNLGRMGVPLATAQKLARHSDPRLTANLYTHIDMKEKSEAVAALPDLPSDESSLVTGMVTGTDASGCALVSSDGTEEESDPPQVDVRNSLPATTYDPESHEMSPSDKARPTGFEPVTCGLEVRQKCPKNAGFLAS